MRAEAIAVTASDEILFVSNNRNCAPPKASAAGYQVLTEKEKQTLRLIVRGAHSAQLDTEEESSALSFGTGKPRRSNIQECRFDVPLVTQRQ